MATWLATIFTSCSSSERAPAGTMCFTVMTPSGRPRTASGRLSSTSVDSSAAPGSTPGARASGVGPVAETRTPAGSESSTIRLWAPSAFSSAGSKRSSSAVTRSSDVMSWTTP